MIPFRDILYPIPWDTRKIINEFAIESVRGDNKDIIIRNNIELGFLAPIRGFHCSVQKRIRREERYFSLFLSRIRIRLKGVISRLVCFY